MNLRINKKTIYATAALFALVLFGSSLGQAQSVT